VHFLCLLECAVKFHDWLVTLVASVPITKFRKHGRGSLFHFSSRVYGMCCTPATRMIRPSQGGHRLP